MTRIKRGITKHAKHKKLLQSNKGYRATKGKLIKVAKEASLHAGQYAYDGRKFHKRDLRREWILRISEYSKTQGLSYSNLIFGLKNSKIELDRKILSDMVINDPKALEILISKIKGNLKN